MLHPGGPSNHCLTSSGLVNASKTSLRGASNTRVITIPRSPCVLNSTPLDLLTLFASMFLLPLLHFVQQCVQPLKVPFPHLPVPFDPHFDLFQRRRSQRINPPLRVHADVNQTRVTQHVKVFGSLRLV